VSVSGRTIEKVKANLEKVMTTHNRFLNNIGMVTNVSKTEVIFFAGKPLQTLPTLEVEGQKITPGKYLKVLDVNFSRNLSWDHHIDNLVKKARPIMLKLKF